VRQTVFLDTSYLLAVIRKRDALHAAALLASVHYTGPFLTTDLILVELANSLSQPPFRATAAIVIDKIHSYKNTQVISFDSEGMEKALKLYKGRPDKAWGLIDCFSFAVMKENRVSTALCFDDHFKQAGFDVPLLEH
jgi:predicted nucleic acid-binding protein